jgi:hypothetical protein
MAYCALTIWRCAACSLTGILFTKYWARSSSCALWLKRLKPFAGNLQAGFFAKTPLSSQLEILNSTVGDPDDQLYDVREFAKPVSGGFMAGLRLRATPWILHLLL